MQGSRVATHRRLRCVEACQICKRRKEKCNGAIPCGRCVERGVESECYFAAPRTNQRRRKGPSKDKSFELVNEANKTSSGDGVEATDAHAVPTKSSSTAVPGGSRLIQDAKGKHIFIGDSANLSLLQNISRLVETSIGPCAFTEDPLRYQMVEPTPAGQANWLQATVPPDLSLETAIVLIRRFFLATGSILDLFHESDLMNLLPGWLENRHCDTGVLSSTYYLVFAVGAQNLAEDKDDLAESFFDHGRYLTAANLMEDPSIATVQAYALITMYMLGASRRNAAFMYLGMAVRAAYALGLHRPDVAALFDVAEFETRERLWKVIRVLDLFMSASMGRPPSTSETRDTESDDNYSASNDLCAIFEAILIDIYAKRMVSTDVLEEISKHHRRWTAKFRRGLENDRIKPEDALANGTQPNIGLLHLKEAYYWTIMLLTRPFLIDFISDYISSLKETDQGPAKKVKTSESDRLLVHACVDSAIRTIELLQVLLNFQDIPKRLPFMVNSTFLSALTLGFAIFGDLDTAFPLEASLTTSQRILALFPHDAIAKGYLTIITFLKEACDIYTEQRAKENMASHANHVVGMFGKVHGLDLEAGLSQTGNRNTSRSSVKSTNTTVNTQSNVDPVSSREGSSNAVAEEISTRDVPNDWFSAPEGFQMLSSDPRYIHLDNLSIDDQDAMTYNFNEFDDSMWLPMTSPKTLWFGSYEENYPLFSTVNMDFPREFMGL